MKILKILGASILAGCLYRKIKNQKKSKCALKNDAETQASATK
ncbi:MULTISPECIES: hypothetical protein [unclassified Acinetobacter]|nr:MULTISPECIES: hypothetical protein [unclassified Acinetobacter]